MSVSRRSLVPAWISSIFLKQRKTTARSFVWYSRWAAWSWVADPAPVPVAEAAPVFAAVGSTTGGFGSDGAVAVARRRFALDGPLRR